MKGATTASLAVAVALANLETTAASAADASACPPSGASWLRVSFSGDSFTPPLHAGVVEQLAADLRRHDVVICDAATASTGAPLADIALTLNPDTTLSLEVRDAVTDKRITRDLPLASVPRDALALSIALAAEELLHASWIEASLAPAAAASSSATAPPAAVAPAKPVPAVVRAVNAEQIARMPEVRATSRPTPLAGQIALMGAVERSTGGSAAAGQTDLGGDLRFSYGGRLVIAARVGARVAPDVGSAHGTVHGHELLAGAGLAYAFMPRDAGWGAELGARADAIDVQFSGATTSGAQAASGSALGAVVSGALGGWGRLGGPWRLVGEVALGAPVRPVAATDEGAAATGVAGLSLGAALGIGATLF
jgi:hypothetical protein